ncbi:MAG: hypothetical protein M0R46_04895 [Candidatus Muirbacterium halophilum]|nr:hypothetical protein [Candidatus Muirbacterium halophilum]MCK9475233.1 hypothetical protein [Candidatus Muirbacterium halophilum]
MVKKILLNLLKFFRWSKFIIDLDISLRIITGEKLVSILFGFSLFLEYRSDFA